MGKTFIFADKIGVKKYRLKWLHFNDLVIQSEYEVTGYNTLYHDVYSDELFEQIKVGKSIIVDNKEYKIESLMVAIPQGAMMVVLDKWHKLEEDEQSKQETTNRIAEFKEEVERMKKEKEQRKLLEELTKVKNELREAKEEKVKFPFYKRWFRK